VIPSRIAKKKTFDAPPKAPRFWLPAAVLIFFPAALIPLSLRDAWFTNEASLLLPNAFVLAAGASALLGFGLLVSRRLSAAFEDHAASAARAGATSHRAWMGAAFLGAAGGAALLKYWQYRSGQLPEDSAAIANVAFNFWDHGGFETSVFGLPSYFAIHFMPVIALFAPIGRLGGLLGMLVAQAVLLCAAPFAVYALVRLKTGSAIAGLAAWWLALTSPLFFLAARASLAPQVCLPAFLLWAVYCAETGRWKATAALVLLGAACTEQAPLVFAGAGLWAALRWPSRRGKLGGVAAAAAAVALWRCEWGVIHSFARPYDFWGAFYARLGPSPRAGLENVLHHPLAFAKSLVWPPAHLAPLAKAFGSTGLFALAAPFELIPFFVAFAPHLAADPSTFYHNLDLHYAAYVLAPLYWATALGAAAVWARLKKSGQERLLLGYALVAGGLNLMLEPPLLMQGRGPQLFWGVPVLAPKIPPDASVWALEYAAAPLAFRKNIQLIYGDGAVGKPGAVLFKPDYVLIDVTYLIEPYKAEQRARMATFLSREGFGAVATTQTMYLLGRREAPAPGAPLEPLGALPEPNDEGRAYEAMMRESLLAPLQQSH